MESTFFFVLQKKKIGQTTEYAIAPISILIKKCQQTNWKEIITHVIYLGKASFFPENGL